MGGEDGREEGRSRGLIQCWLNTPSHTLSIKPCLTPPSTACHINHLCYHGNWADPFYYINIFLQVDFEHTPKRVLSESFIVIASGAIQSRAERRPQVRVWPKGVTNSGNLSACCSKANKEARLVEGKVSLILHSGNQGGGQTSVWRLTPISLHHPSDNQWARAVKGGGRGLWAETALTVILKLVTWWCDQGHLDCINYN